MRFLANILAKAGLVVDGAVTLNNVAAASTNTDRFLVVDSGVVKYRTGSQLLSDISAVGGSGTINYVSKFTGATTLGNSQVFDDGTSVGINTNTPSVKFEVAGGSRVSGTIQSQTYTSGLGTSTTALISSLVQSSQYSATSVHTILGVVSSPNVTASSGFTSVLGGSFDPIADRTSTSATLTITGVRGTAYRNSSTTPSGTMSSTLTGVQGLTGHWTSQASGANTLGAIGVWGNVTSQKSTITNGYGIFSQIQLSTDASAVSPTVNNYYGVYTTGILGRSDGTTIGTLTNYYDAYLAGATVNSGIFVTKRWGVYQANVSHPNYFAAIVQIGSNTSTGETLQVTGTQRVTQDAYFATASGSVGIGTTSPSELLDVNGRIRARTIDNNAAPTFFLTSDANGVIQKSTYAPAGGSGTTNYVARWTSSSALGTGVLFDNGSFVGVGVTSNFAGGPRLYVSKTTASEEIFRVDGQGGAGCLIISNTASSVQTVFYNGNIGVGTLSPQQKLVVSNVGAEGLEFIPAPSVNSNQIQSYNRSTSSWNSLILRASEYNVQIGTTATLYINGSGNIGIGTTTPNTKLDVVATKNTTGLRLSPSAASAANDYTQIGVGNPGADVDYASIRFTYENGLSNWYNTAISFHTFARFPGNALLERMRINGDGYVGIATSNPLNFLDVYSNNRTSLTAIGGGINVNYTGNTTGQFSTIGFSWAQSIDGATRWGMGLTGTSFASGLADLFFFNGGVERMRITSAGNIGIGATSGITGKLTISSSLGDQIKLDRTGQTSRGIVISAADNLSIGTWVDPTQVSITPSGNVGIGTTGPSKKLVVAAPPPTFSGDDGIIVIDPATANQTYLARCGSTYTYRAVPPNAGMLYSNTDLSLLADSGYAITFHTSSGHVARLTAAGNFGIGTTSPTERLDVRTTVVRDPSSGEAHAAFYTNAAQSIDRGASITLGGGINNAGTSVTNFATISGLKENSTENNTAGTLSFWTRVNAGPMTRKMTITSDGNVGIGNTSAYYRTHISQPKNTTGLFISNSPSVADDYTQIGFGFDTYNVAGAAIRAVAENPAASFNHHLTFHTYNTTLQERMRITSAGNVGIGTTSPSAPLMFGKSVYGAPSSEDFYRIKFEDVGGIHNDVGIGQPAAGAIGFNFLPSTGYIMFNEGTSNERMRIAAGGNVGIGTTSPSAKLHVNGTFISNALWTDALSIAYWGSYATAYGGLSWDTGYALVFAAGGNTLRLGANGSGTHMIINTSGNVGIGTLAPSASSILELNSTTRGFLPPKMTAAQRAAISSPAVGLVVYQTDSTEGLWIYTSANGWKALAIVT